MPATHPRPTPDVICPVKGLIWSCIPGLMPEYVRWYVGGKWSSYSVKQSLALYVSLHRALQQV